MTRLLTIVTTIVALQGAVVSGQGPSRDSIAAQTGTAVIAGVVVGADARPIRRVTVTLSSGDMRTPRITATDDEGRFVFGDLPPGNFALSAYRPAYVPAFLGSKTPGRGPGTPIALLANQRRTDIRLTLFRGSVISGILRHQTGQPASGVAIDVMAVRTFNGGRTIGSSEQQVTTDDRGAYRAFGLRPGDYVIRAIPVPAPAPDVRQVTPAEWQWVAQWPSSAAMPIQTAAPAAALPRPPMVYAPVYYPGTADPQSAATVSLGPGEENNGVDFITMLVPTAKVTGTLSDTNGLPRAGVTVALSLSEAGPSDRFGLTARTAADGTFAISGVPPGQFVLSTRATAPSEQGTKPPTMSPFYSGGQWFGTDATSLWATEDVSINGRDVGGLSLRLQPLLTVSGRLEFDDASVIARPDLRQTVIRLVRPSSGLFGLMQDPSGAVAADGTFDVKGLAPDRYQVHVTMPGMMTSAGEPGSGWVLKSAMLNGRDISQLPFDIRPGENPTGLVITMTDRPTEFSGVVIDPAGRPTASYQLAVFATDRAYWAAGSRRLVVARPATDGRFRFVGLPAGEYFVSAVFDLQSDQLADPACLELLATTSIRIALADGAKKIQDIKLAGR